ncbi:RnfH family protein [Thermomonas brevis]
MRVELLRAWPDRHDAVTVELPAGVCVDDALRAAGWALDATFVGLAVFGVAADGATRLHEGDRVELLRPLQMDPKQARRLRAQRARERAAAGR